MTILVTSIWGGRVAVVVDRQISKRHHFGVTVLDTEAAKLLVVLCSDALFSISYTGVADTEGAWLDEVIASCLAARRIEPAMVQPGGGFFLERPMHELIRNLAFNLPIRLRGSPTIALMGLTLVVAGWHLRPRCIPFVWEVKWHSDASKVGGSMTIARHQVGKFFRQFASGIWMHTWGDVNESFDERIRRIAEATERLTHDDVEERIVDAIERRSRETPSVGERCLALHLDPRDVAGPIQFTYYPGPSAKQPNQLLSGWLLTPTLIHSPTRETTRGSSYSECGRYVLGGFSDGARQLHVRTRLPLVSVTHGGPTLMSYETQLRKRPM